MERAALVLYDTATRAVRSAGSHGAETALVAQINTVLDDSPLSQRALAEDRVLVASEDLERELPRGYAQFFGLRMVACTPVAAGGRWFGAIFSDQGGGAFELTAEERQTMLTLGRLAALAASVEGATRKDERSSQLNERIGLVRDIHERAMQRLFGVTLALGSGEPLSAAELRACHDELQMALSDLRSALGRPMSSHGRPPRTTLREMLDARAERMPELVVSWGSGVEIPVRLEPLAQAVFLEALRNCEKHAEPKRIDVRVAHAEGALELDVANDGIAASGGGAGIGLRLLTLEALQEDALVEFGPLPEGRWHVRMVGATS